MSNKTTAELIEVSQDRDIPVNARCGAVMILYIYNTDNRNVIARVHGNTNADCEGLAAEIYGDDYGWTYTPAFGANDGLIYAADVEEVQS